MQTQRIVDSFNELLQQARAAYQRRCLVLAGDHTWCQECIKQIFGQLELPNSLIVSNGIASLPNVTHTEMDHALEFLGHEFKLAVIDGYDGVDPNVLGAISGTVVGGGILVLLLPAIDELADFADPHCASMAIWPFTARQVGNRFLQRLSKILNTSAEICLIQQHHHFNSTHPAIMNQTEINKGYLQNEICASLDQQQALQAILKVVNGHRRRPLVITANRGRGKSALLGIAAAQLLASPNTHIIITGPRLAATEVVFKHVLAMLPNGMTAPGRFSFGESVLEYVAADKLCQDYPPCRLLLVDEAAAIPTPMLEKLLRHYSRIVFSTTTYGYEGTGRGFAVRFMGKLDQITPAWKQCEMDMPVRWRPGDPVEKFMYEALCLGAMPDEISTITPDDEIAIQKINRDDLITDNKLLEDIFSLLVLAHYQTQPRDLRYLLDGIHLEVFVAIHQGHIIGTAIVSREGEFDGDISQAVYRNLRRVQGHMLAQTFESFIGIQNASAQRFWRIMRIAVHPACRRKHIGSRLLKALESFARNEQVDVIGSVFGASPDTLSFWQANNFKPAHIGLKKNASHGGHTITYIKPISDQGEHIYQQALEKFQREFPFNLANRFYELEPSIIIQVFSAFLKPLKLTLSGNDWDAIKDYSQSQRDYEHAALPVSLLITQLFFRFDLRELLSESDINLLISKVLQRNSWSQVVKGNDFTGKQTAKQQLRTVVSTLTHIKQVTDLLP